MNPGSVNVVADAIGDFYTRTRLRNTSPQKMLLPFGPADTMSAPQPAPLDMPPEPNWDDMSDSEKFHYGRRNRDKLSPTQFAEWFELTEKQIDARSQQQSDSHKQVVREKLDQQHAEQKAHVRITDQFVHGPRRCVDCGRPALRHSERCYTCESD